MSPDSGAHNPNSNSGSASSVRKARRVIVLVDLAGWARACRNRNDVELAKFLNDYYSDCAEAFESAGGRVVKFMGDACLAVFPVERAQAAVEAVIGLRKTAVATGARHGLAFPGMGANLHIDEIAEGELGPGPGENRRFDIVGSGVNHTFLMGGGEGIRISEPVYRQLESSARTPWQKHKPPATYRYVED